MKSAHNTYNFHYHLVWKTKYSNKVFTTEKLVSEMKETLQTIANSYDIIIETMEIMPDHVHMLISFSPNVAPSKVVQILKGTSSYLFMRNHPEIKKSQFWSASLWSRSYYMRTLGDMSKEVVKHYILNQYN